MKIILGGWFSLPRLERDEFSLLMRQGVRYDRSLGFRLDSETDLEAAARTIRAATGEEVELALRCFVCGREACDGCPYLEVCDRKKVSSLCLCSVHAPDTAVFELYSKAISESIPS